MDNNLIDMFIGSEIEVKYISALLNEQNIKHMIVNTLEESTLAGWAASSPCNSTTLKVHSQDAEKARNIINEYIELSIK
ncbi:MAG: DUF2007 domain-containing protein [Lentimicrobiaceae bacterium]|nr:DUF2007 domain-containing protein [Lentimicrobiaceae bacterium]